MSGLKILACEFKVVNKIKNGKSSGHDKHLFNVVSDVEKISLAWLKSTFCRHIKEINPQKRLQTYQFANSRS